MKRKGMTIKEATYEWVREFNLVPQGVVRKLMDRDADDVEEVTPPSLGRRVYIFMGEHSGEYGEIVGKSDENNIEYIITTDDGETVVVSMFDFDIERDDYLPMWSAMWTFGDSLDNEWLNEDGLQIMADCGFRIYEQEDYGYIFGIDGAGYDFYEDHWIPLYKARGLQWHDPETEKEGVCQ